MRKVDNFIFKITEGEVESIRLRVLNGETGDHIVDYDGKEWYCDCKGFSVRKICRHLRMGQAILYHAWCAIDDIRKLEEE